MFRKISSMVTAVVVIFAMLPAMAASAAASGSANLLAPTTVFPSATDANSAANNDIVIRVTNTQPTVSLNGVGSTISQIRITFPPNVGSPVCPATPPGGFACLTFGQPGAEGIALANGAITPNSSLDIPFKATVNAPSNNDRTDAFRVQVSDGTGFSTANGALGLKVRALEVLQASGTSGIALQATRASTTFDAVNRVTSGQQVTANYTVKNHAQNLLGVNAQLTPTNLTTQTAFTDPAGNGGTSLATFSVNTNNVTSGTTTVNLQSDARSTNAVGDTRSQSLLIDAPVSLDVQGLGSGLQQIIANGVGLNLKLAETKAQPPRIDALSTSISLKPADFANAGAITASTTTAVGAGTQNLTLDFGAQTIGFAEIEACRGSSASTCRTDGLYPIDATITQSGFDSNGASVSYTETINGLFIIDIAAPFITVVAGVADYADTAAADRVKQGDTISISGTVRTAQGSSTVPADIDAASLAITVGGREVTNESYNASTGNFTGSFTVPVNDGPGGTPTFGEAGTVNVAASISDKANNANQADASLTVDNIAPFLSPVSSVDHDNDPATPPLDNPLSYLVEGDLYGEDADYVVRASFNPGGGNVISELGNDPVAGGCSPTQWRVDDATVTDVLYWNGEPCQNGQAAPAFDGTQPPGSSVNDRIIVVLEDIDPRDLPINLTYTPDGAGLGGLLVDPVIDLVENEALRQIATVLNGLTPLLPNILEFERNDITAGDANPDGEYEAVGQSDRNGEVSYHFNTTNLQITLDQVTVGDLLAFRDADTGAFLGEVEMGANGEYIVTNAQLQGLGSTLAPAENTSRRIAANFRREVPGQPDLVGPLLNFVLVHDTVAPGLAAITAEPTLRATGQTNTFDVDVFFTEELNAGTNDPMFWSALYRNPDAASGDNPYIPHLTNSVSADPANRTLRTLRIETNGTNSVDAFDYEYLDFGNDAYRYEDLAGNLTAGSSFVAQ